MILIKLCMNLTRVIVLFHMENGTVVSFCPFIYFLDCPSCKELREAYMIPCLPPPHVSSNSRLGQTVTGLKGDYGRVWMQVSLILVRYANQFTILNSLQKQSLLWDITSFTRWAPSDDNKHNMFRSAPWLKKERLIHWTCFDHLIDIIV